MNTHKQKVCIFNPITKVIEYLNKHNGLYLKQNEPREFVELKLFANKNPNCFTRTITDELRESLGTY